MKYCFKLYLAWSLLGCGDVYSPCCFLFLIIFDLNLEFTTLTCQIRVEDGINVEGGVSTLHAVTEVFLINVQAGFCWSCTRS